MFFFSRLKKSRRPWMKRGLKRPWSCGAGIIHACQDWSHRSIKNCDLNPDICFCPDASRQTPERFFSINTATASLFFSHVFFDYSKCPVCLQELRKQPEDVQTPGSSQTGVWTASCKSSPDAVTFTLLTKLTGFQGILHQQQPSMIHMLFASQMIQPERLALWMFY